MDDRNIRRIVVSIMVGITLFGTTVGVIAVTENTSEGFLNMTGIMDTEGHTLDVTSGGKLPVEGAGGGTDTTPLVTAWIDNDTEVQTQEVNFDGTHRRLTGCTTSGIGSYNGVGVKADDGSVGPCLGYVGGAGSNVKFNLSQGSYNYGEISTGSYLALIPQDGDIQLEPPSGHYVRIMQGEGLMFMDNSVQKEPGGRSFSFVSQHTSYSNGLTDEEIYRAVMESGEQLEIHRVEVRPKGGGSDTATVDVYDATAGTVIASQQGGGVTLDPGSSGSGNTVLFRVSNNTGSAVVWSITIQGRIK